MAEEKEKLQKNDFVEIEYKGKTRDSSIFDTNIKEEAEKIGLKIEAKPMIICLGQNMILKAIDEFLIGKEIGDYTLELPPEKAFGYRKREFVRTMPISVFSREQIMPQAGMIFSFDSMLGKITAVSGGRVIVDFNNPLANKEVIYELKVKRKITNEEEKVKALIFFFFRKEFSFKIEDKKIIIEAEKNYKEFIALFSGKFKELLNLELEVKEIEATKEQGKTP